jgi:hypothetical protein
MSDFLREWASDPTKAGTLPYAAFEPRYPHKGVGAVVVVRGVLYFKGGYSRDGRANVVKCFERYRDTLNAPLTWYFQEGKRAAKIEKAPALKAVATGLSENEGFVFEYTSAETSREAGSYHFSAFCLEKWQADMGTRGLDVLTFSVPISVVKATPEVVPVLFQQFASDLNAIHGHAGYAVNLPPTGIEENEGSEFFFSQKLGPGLDIGEPSRNAFRELSDKLKTVDWLVALGRPLVSKLGGRQAISLPPDWYRVTPYGDGGLIVQAGVQPCSGSEHVGKGEAAVPPPAYVVLNAALRPVMAETVGTLQNGTATGDAPVYNTESGSNAWLHRFDVSDEQLIAAHAAVLQTPKLSPAS